MSKKPLFIILTLLSALAVLVSCSNSVDDIFDDKPETTPLTLEFIEDGEFSVYYDSYADVDYDVYYSLNGGKKTLAEDDKEYAVSKGDKVSFYRTFDSSLPGNARITIKCTKDCYVYGNAMSLVDSTNYATITEVPAHALQCLFLSNKYIKNHDTLDIVLPATEIGSQCYDSMFQGCTQLTKAPELPATKMAAACYARMFENCSSLAKAPELPAKELGLNCYDGMFKGCTALTESPVLPAETLDELYCYYSMFYGCTNLKSVTCLATIIESSLNVDYWLENAGSAVTGSKEFHCKADSTIWTQGPSGNVPADWTIMADK